MEDEVIFEPAIMGSFVPDLIRSRQYLKGSSLLAALDEVIKVELELALMGALKAKSELAKKSAKENSPVRPIK